MKYLAKRPIKKIFSFEGREIKEGDIVYSRNLGKGIEPLTVFIERKGFRGQFWAIKKRDGAYTGCGDADSPIGGVSFEPLDPLPPPETESNSTTYNDIPDKVFNRSHSRYPL